MNGSTMTQVDRESSPGASPVFHGGCLCGAIRYRAAGQPSGLTLCHCATCRRASGAPCVAWGSFAAHSFVFTQGEPARYQSSPGVERTFCGRCGTALTYVRADASEFVDATLASLDDPEAVGPFDHTWVGDKLSWMVLGDDMPRYARHRPTIGQVKA
jgi:hypothetical protein